MEKTHGVVLLALGLLLAGCQFKGAEREPGVMLADYKWVVEQIGGQGVNANSRVTLLFSNDGRIAGRASCNRMNGRYEAAENSLTFADLGTTRMACPDPLMEQEQRFLDTLESVQTYAISQHGALLLYRGEEVVVEALPEGD